MPPEKVIFGHEDTKFLEFY